MFDKEKFKELLFDAMGERTQEEFAELCDVNRTYISKYLNMRLDNPPSPNILKRIAQNARNEITYEQLMDAAGHINRSELGLAYVEVGRYISIMRQKKGISQETLAELSGVSIDTISEIESGKLQEPSTDILRSLAPHPQAYEFFGLLIKLFQALPAFYCSLSGYNPAVPSPGTQQNPFEIYTPSVGVFLKAYF